MAPLPTPLEIVIARSANRYLERLDRPTQERVRRRLRDIAVEPENFHFPNHSRTHFYARPMLVV